MGTFLAVLAFLLATGALLYAWIARQELNRANRRLDRMNRALFELKDELRRQGEEQAEKMAEMQGALARMTGQALFRPEMRVREVLALHPQARHVLASYHLGGCSSCALDPNDRLDQVCRSSGVDSGELIARLNALFRANGNGLPDGSTQPIKAPNIELSF